ncbi:MAG TPA: response regulator transcription factor, partial [Candidatus Sulfotelmatobacter sp.]|nr:response regulator transcription factor [Candidatus Sulfotelmatobacter sp.]
GVQIIGEVADGLEAVQKAVLLEPDLVLLDIGLPTLNGIEAARQIRKLTPASKIIFLTQESSVRWCKKHSNWGHGATLQKKGPQATF